MDNKKLIFTKSNYICIILTMSNLQSTMADRNKGKLKLKTN